MRTGIIGKADSRGNAKSHGQAEDRLDGGVGFFHHPRTETKRLAKRMINE